jgi:hypothetical protein
MSETPRNTYLNFSKRNTLPNSAKGFLVILKIKIPQMMTIGKSTSTVGNEGFARKFTDRNMFMIEPRYMPIKISEILVGIGLDRSLAKYAQITVTVHPIGSKMRSSISEKEGEMKCTIVNKKATQQALSIA